MATPMPGDGQGEDRTVEEKEKSTRKETPEVDFVGAVDVFWERYPRQRRGDKRETLAAWKKARQTATEEEILNGMEAYIGSSYVSDGYAKGAAAWLNACRWTWDYSYQPKAGGSPQGKPSQTTRCCDGIA